MSVSLSKNQAVSLAKQSGAGLATVTLGVGWDVARPRGLLSALFGGAAPSIDLDASAIVYDRQGHALDTVWFRQLVSRDGAIRHTGDNLTGEGEGDDEAIVIDLTRLPADVEHVVLTVNSFRGQTFDKVENAYGRVVDNVTGRELARFGISDSGQHTGLILSCLSRAGGEWRFRAIGHRTNGRTVQDLVGEAAHIL
ncbi:MAG TPA: TerD family protein [Novosphingobium sp.]|nr:TerD family protein [Novosphingobium sp.]